MLDFTYYLFITANIPSKVFGKSRKITFYDEEEF